MGAEEGLITGLKEELEKSSTGSNLASLFLLVALEKILEVEFACPCDPKWNKIFVLLFFLIPAVASSLLVLWIRGFSIRLEALSNIIATVLLWMALTLLNGQFLVCAFSDWPGTFVTADKTYLNWCKPANTTIYSTEELLKYSHRLYIWSQVSGSGLVMILVFFLIAYTIYEKRKRPRIVQRNYGTSGTEEHA